MNKPKAIGSVALAGLMNLVSASDVSAEAKFSGSVSLGGYLPSTEQIGKGGLPFGVDFRGDYGIPGIGFWTSVAWYGKTKRESNEYGYYGLGDGETEGSDLLRWATGLRFGSSLKHISVGVVIGEENNYFEERDLGFSTYRIDRDNDYASFYGLTGGFNIGGKVKDSEVGLFFRGEMDYLLHQSFDEPVWGVKFSVGANFTAP